MAKRNQKVKQEARLEYTWKQRLRQLRGYLKTLRGKEKSND